MKDESGLIDRLPQAWSDEVGDCVSRDDIRTLLRSNETRQALALALGRAEADRTGLVDAVVRLLIGEAS